DTKLDQFETEKSQLISQLSQKNGETQEIEKKQVNVAKELQKYQKTAKELMEELRSHYVDKLQEQAENGNERKNLDKNYQQETARNQHTLQKKATVTKETADKKSQLETIIKQAQA